MPVAEPEDAGAARHRAAAAAICTRRPKQPTARSAAETRGVPETEPEDPWRCPSRDWHGGCVGGRGGAAVGPIRPVSTMATADAYPFPRLAGACAICSRAGGVSASSCLLEHFGDMMDDGSEFLLLGTAVMAVAWFGGIGPALLAVLAGAGASGSQSAIADAAAPTAPGALRGPWTAADRDRVRAAPPAAAGGAQASEADHASAPAKRRRDEGRVPRHALPRASDAAERGARLGTPVRTDKLDARDRRAVSSPSSATSAGRRRLPATCWMCRRR